MIHRGPPKHYTAIIEKRLIETEAILLALMSQVSDQQLMSAYDHLQQDKQSSVDLGEPSNSGHRHELTRKDKFGTVYWSNYTLNSAQDARRWWADRVSAAERETPSRQHEDTEPALRETNLTSERANTMLQDADVSAFRTNELSSSVESPIAPRLSVGQQDDRDARVNEDLSAESTSSIHEEEGTRRSRMVHLEHTPARSTGDQNFKDVGGYESAYLW